MFKKMLEGVRDLAANPELDRVDRRFAYAGAASGLVIGLGVAGVLIVNYADDTDLLNRVRDGVLIGTLVAALLMAAAVWHVRRGRRP